MPFIRGRYHMNPIAGRAIEAAREAEAARLASSGQESQDEGPGYGNSDASPNDAGTGADPGPIHRVEIEAAEMVPTHSGRAERGFVARVHRQALGYDASAARRGEFSPNAHASRPDTHVFSDHRDLVDFLHREFAKDCTAK
jgi:hypothetical protein